MFRVRMLGSKDHGEMPLTTQREERLSLVTDCHGKMTCTGHQ